MAALNIQIEVPNMNVYDLEELKHKVTIYARNLIISSYDKANTQENTSKNEKLAEKFANEKDENDIYKTTYNKKYSARINYLRSLCGKEISQEAIQEDERLAYLLSK